MNDFYQHTNSELISLLLDGQLDREQEKALYQNISSDSEMQEELQELLSIRESVKKDHEAYNPPAELTNKVFAGLGYSVPFASEAPTAAVTAGVFTAGLFKKMLPYVALVVAGFSVIVFNQFRADKTIETADTKAASVLASGVSEVSSLIDESFNSPSDNTIASDNSSNIATANKENKSNFVFSNNHNSNNSNSENISSNADIAIDRKLDKMIGNSYPANSTYRFDKIMIEKTGMVNSFSNFNNFDSYWYVQAMGIFAGSMAENNLPTQSSAIWSNINFGIFRQLNNSFSLGVQFGMEPYNIYQTDNNDVAYLNSKDVFWVTLAGRYDMKFASLYSVTPYVSLAAGGSTVGFMSRGMAGLNYRFENLPLDLNIGYETSLINYSVFKDYTATKNGIVAGFNIRF